ncbi:MAG: helix-turn-helix domain-containing protein [Saprospiraceae bacterium]
MINFNTRFESLRASPKSNSSNKNRRYPTHTTTFSSNKKVTTITQTQRMKKSTFNNKKAQEWLNELEHQMIMNISKMNFTANDLAAYMDISHRQLYRLMHERLGETPHHYIKNFRLNYARELLETQQVKSVKAAAYSTGFPNTTYFSKQFKAKFGYSPSELL